MNLCFWDGKGSAPQRIIQKIKNGISKKLHKMIKKSRTGKSSGLQNVPKAF
jgi:hypothetical protein